MSCLTNGCTPLSTATLRIALRVRTRTCAPLRVPGPEVHSALREFHEPGFDILLCKSCADSSSLQISTTLFGHFELGNNSLRKSLQHFHKNCAAPNRGPLTNPYD